MNVVALAIIISRRTLAMMRAACGSSGFGRRTSVKPCHERSTTETVKIAAEEAGRRLDRVLAARIPALSRSRLKALILAGQVDDRGAHDPRSGHAPSIPATPSPSPCRAPEPAKPAGEASRSTSSTRTTSSSSSTSRPAWWCTRPPATPAGTLVNALIAHCGDSLSGIGGVKRPGIVHRLDKDTSGLMVVAKTDARPPRALRPIRQQGRRRAGARLSRLRLGRARPAQGHHRRRRSTATRMRATSARCAKAAAQR